MAQQHRSFTEAPGGLHTPSQLNPRPPPYQVSVPADGMTDAFSRLDPLSRDTIPSSSGAYPIPHSVDASKTAPVVAPDHHDSSLPRQSNHSTSQSSRRTEQKE